MMMMMTFNIHGKQLRSCRDGQLLNHTVPGQATWRQFTHLMYILSPVTDNLLFLNQWKRDYFPRNNVPDVRVDLGTAAYEADMVPTELRTWFKVCCGRSELITKDTLSRQFSHEHRQH